MTMPSSKMTTSRGRATAPLAPLALAAALSACPSPSGLDAGVPPADGGAGQDDAGVVVTDAGTSHDAGDVDAGPPPTLFQRVVALCTAHVEGARLASQLAAVSTTRCSAVESIPDHALDPSEAVADPLQCLPGQPLFALYETALAGGRVVVDEARVVECTAAARALRAAHPTWGDAALLEDGLRALASSGACAALLAPALVEGDPCVQAWDCPSGTACEAALLDESALACLAPAALGAACDDGAPGRTAVRTCTAEAACFDGICAAKKPANQVCGPGQVPCQDDLVCGPQSICAPPAALGAPCREDAHCAVGLRCAGVAPGVDGVCAALVDDGGACDVDAACRGACSVCRPTSVGGPLACQDRAAGGGACLVETHCREGFVCGADGTCTPFLGLGATCGADVPCAPVYTCAPGAPSDAGVSSSTCVAPAQIGSPCAGGENPCVGGACVDGVCVAGVAGDPCVDDDGCRDGLLCVVGACVVAPREDAPCTVDGRCDDGLTCVDGRCAGLPEPGDACLVDVCADGAFCDDGTCVGKRAAGAPCVVDGECAGGVCLSTGTCAATTPSCLSTEDAFSVFMIFAVMWPLGRRARRLL